MSELSRAIVWIHVLFLALIIVPFLFWSADIEAFVERALAGEHHLEIAGLTVAILAADVLLPVPSSFVGMTAIVVLGGPVGALSLLGGLTLSCLIGYAIGYYCRRAVFERFYGDAAFRDLSIEVWRYGSIALVVCRGIPVLAELSVMAAGFFRFGAPRLLLVTLIANMLITLVYVFLGARLESDNAMPLLLLGVLVVPAGTYLIRRLWLRLRSPAPGLD